ncbi:MAG: PorV/PorQ family protein [Bacteroidales bacterium]|nr:PorV/PorQ family protein [Bacteroidales bacterium]
MNKIHKIISTVVLLTVLLPGTVLNAGNDDRRGTAGAGELLINPWARSAGWSNVNTANGTGIDALFTNAAGLGHTQGTDFYFNYTNYLNNSDIGLISAGLAQSLGDYGVLGLSVNSMSFGTIQRTKTSSPEVGDNGTFKPTLMNIGVSFAKAFSSSIYAGVTLKVVSEGIDNVTATGVGFDAGIQYVTGADYEIKFGISLKNWGPSMSFSGDGLAISSTVQNATFPMTTEQRSLAWELPSSLNIGASYDFLFSEKEHRLTVAGNYESMAFTKDLYTLGLEYGFRSLFMVRCGYTYQGGGTNDIYDSDSDKTNFSTGFAAGVTVNAPIIKAKGDKRSKDLSIDYAYRMTVIMGGLHTVGVRLTL